MVDAGDNALALQGLRRAAYRLSGWQLVITAMVVTGAAWIAGSAAALSALVGGAIGTVTGLYQAVRLFRTDASQHPESFMGAVYAGEAVKILLTAALFVFAIKALRAEFLPLILGYIATLVVYWAALGTGFPWLTSGADERVEHPNTD